MTMLRYPVGCSAGSQVHTLAWSMFCCGEMHPASSLYAGSSNDAWIVYFHSGLVYDGYRSNGNAVRLVRASQ